MANYKFSVHYDYYVTVDVEADSFEEAQEKAQLEADDTKLGEGDWGMELTNLWLEYTDDDKKCYTIQLYDDDGTNVGWWTPEELEGKAFHTQNEAEEWLEINGYDIRDADISEEDFDEDEYEWYQ